MDQIVEKAKAEMGTLEALFKGLPGIRDYVDKELRRAADKRLRDQLVDHLQGQKTQLVQIQKQLLDRQGLKWVAHVDTNVQRLQTTIDRIRTASYGYAGFFSEVRIQEEALNELYRFDQMLAQQAAAVDPAVAQLATARDDEAIRTALDQLAAVIAELNTRFEQRKTVLASPELLATVFEIDRDIAGAADVTPLDQ
jgi:dsDNA-specific endonuclease/ATPase MutS2